MEKYMTLDDARETIENWRLGYNQVRLHSALDYLSESNRMGAPLRARAIRCAHQARCVSDIRLRPLTRGKPRAIPNPIPKDLSKSIFQRDIVHEKYHIG
jgi:hypothetical protein